MLKTAFKSIAAILLAAAASSFALQSVEAYELVNGPTGVISYNKEKSVGGYTLFAPIIGSTTTYLINMEGDIVHSWKSDYTPGLYAVLLPNGNLLRSGAPKEQPVKIGGAGGILQEFDWDGKLVWEYKMLSPNEIQHHCFDRLANGNTLILGWERKSTEEAVKKGRKPGTWGDNVKIKGQLVKDFWVDFVREVDKDGKTVWEWHVWDHIGTGPDQLDINYMLPAKVGAGYDDFDWSHFNTVEYLPDTDQVLLNSRNLAEMYIIDKKTGKIIKRWGNPSAYGAGKKPGWYDDGDQQIFGSHHATRLPNGNFQIFDNGSERPEGNRSRVLELDGKSFDIVWQYATRSSNSFYSYRQGAAQYLPGGNRLIISTHNGHLFEVTPDGEVVWEFVNPIFKGEVRGVFKDKEGMIDPAMARESSLNMIHRAYRYPADYSGLKGRDLSVKAPLLPNYPKFFEIWKENGK